MTKSFLVVLFASLSICFTMTSCEKEDLFDNRKCVATYTYNYYWDNALGEDITIYFSSYDSNRKFARLVDKQIVLAPNTMTKVEVEAKQSFIYIGSNEQAPVYTIADAPHCFWYDAPTEGYTFGFDIQIGDNERQSLDIEKNKSIFLTENYRSETLNDTTFNFYFTIDEAYLSMLCVAE